MAIDAPLHRAIFMMFLVSEVHPFSDGNGRVARLMMNAELASAGETRILIPTVYRTDYLLALKATSQTANPAPLIRALDFAQRYTGAINFSTLDTARELLERTHAFLDPEAAEVAGHRLTIP